MNTLMLPCYLPRCLALSEAPEVKKKKEQGFFFFPFPPPLSDWLMVDSLGAIVLLESVQPSALSPFISFPARPPFPPVRLSIQLYPVWSGLHGAPSARSEGRGGLGCWLPRERLQNGLNCLSVCCHHADYSNSPFLLIPQRLSGWSQHCRNSPLGGEV